MFYCFLLCNLLTL